MKKYLCGVDFQEELGYTDVRLYDSLKDLKENSICWPSCGIIEMDLDE